VHVIIGIKDFQVKNTEHDAILFQSSNKMTFILLEISLVFLKPVPEGVTCSLHLPLPWHYQAGPFDVLGVP
jgi:hypothetical protein